MRGYQTRFATSGFFAGPDVAQPELHDFLRGLLDVADERGKQPVLKFCCSIGRIGWMRRHFPDAVQIVVLRDPFAQYASSAQKFAVDGLGHFLGRLLLALNRDRPLTDRAIRHLGVELPDVSNAGRRKRSCRPGWPI